MSLYTPITKALQAHWAAHENKYPQKLVLSAIDHADLMQNIRVVRTGLGSTRPPDPHKFMDIPMEVGDGPSVMVALDGTLMPLSEGG